MKKILLCLVVAIFLTNCEIRITNVNAQGGTEAFITDPQGYVDVWSTTKELSGMKYATLYNNHGMAVINLTKDSVEVALLRKQLEKIQCEK